MSSPKVSIVIPVYNTEKYLERCIKSITAQSFSDFEIICVDDASSDNSCVLLKKLAAGDSRIKVFQNAENQGAGYTKNVALKKTVGEYVCFVDSDDWIVDGTLQILYDSATAYKADDVFYLSYGMAETAGRLTSGLSAWKNFPGTRICTGLELLNAMLDEKCLTVGAVHHFARTELVKKYASFSERTVNDDMQFSCNLLARLERVLFLKKEFYVYFHRSQGSISNTPKSVRLANECVLHGINLYKSVSRIGSDLARDVARKLLKHAVLAGKSIALYSSARDRRNFIPQIFNEASAEGLYIDISDEALSEMHDDLYIYGVGNYAVDIYRQLLEKKRDIQAFIVTKPEQKEFLGKSVVGIADFAVPESATLIIGTSEKFYDEILAEPKVRQFSTVIPAVSLKCASDAIRGGYESIV